MQLRAGRERIGIGIVIGIGSGDGDREMEREGVPTGASWEHTVMRRSGLSCFRVFSGRPCRDSLVVDYVYVDYFLLPKGLLNGAV